MSLPFLVKAGYQPLSRLGRGGNGVVLLALDVRLQRKVAIKILDDRVGDPVGFRRFLGEAQLVAQNPHEAIVPVLDANLESEPPFVAFRYMVGGSLLEWINTGEPRTPATVLDIGIRLARALHHLHSQEILHRDVKPANVLLDERGEAYLADFGLGTPEATAGKGHLTATGHIVGTPVYMAPEIYEAGKYSASTDIFALGATLLEVATGRRIEDLAQRSKFLQELLREVPDSNLRRLLRLCLRTLPEDRPKSGAKLADEMAVAREQISAMAIKINHAGKKPALFGATETIDPEEALQAPSSFSLALDPSTSALVAKRRPPASPVWREGAFAVLLFVCALVGGHLSARFGAPRGRPLLPPLPPRVSYEQVQGRDWEPAPLVLVGIAASKEDLTAFRSGAEEVRLWDTSGASYKVTRGPQGGLRLEAWEWESPGRLRWSHRELASAETKVSLEALVVDPRGGYASFQRTSIDGATQSRTGLLWSEDGAVLRRWDALSDGEFDQTNELTPLALVTDALLVRRGEAVLRVGRGGGEVQRRWRVDVGSDPHLRLGKSGIRLRAGPSAAWLLAAKN